MGPGMAKIPGPGLEFFYRLHPEPGDFRPFGIAVPTRFSVRSCYSDFKDRTVSPPEASGLIGALAFRVKRKKIPPDPSRCAGGDACPTIEADASTILKNRGRTASIPEAPPWGRSRWRPAGFGVRRSPSPSFEGPSLVPEVAPESPSNHGSMPQGLEPCLRSPSHRTCESDSTVREPRLGGVAPKARVDLRSSIALVN